MSAGHRHAPRPFGAQDLAGGVREWSAAGSVPGADQGRAPAGRLEMAPAAGDAAQTLPRLQVGQAIHGVPAQRDDVPAALRPDPARPSSSPDPIPWAQPATTAEARGLAGVTFSTTDLVGLRARAAGLSLDAHRSRRGGRAGVRVSRLRGRGMEYSESRAYLPGDDIRSIDWRVTARTGRVHTKLFHEERDRPILFVVDLGKHMRFGTRRAFKSVLAAETASLLAWAAVANGDRVGGLVFAGEHTAESGIQGGWRGTLALIRALVGIENETKALGARDGLGDALTRARRHARPGTLVIVISDFSGLRDSAAKQFDRLREHNDLLCVWIYDRLESMPPPPARYPIGDGRRTATLDVRSNEVARAIAYRFEGIERQITSGCRRAGAVLVQISCGDDVRAVLRETLTSRIRRPSYPTR